VLIFHETGTWYVPHTVYIMSISAPPSQSPNIELESSIKYAVSNCTHTLWKQS